MTKRSRSDTAALVIAHPGHELRIHHWLETVKPKVYVLTDGSGSGARGRLDSTHAVLSAAGAEIGSVAGSWTDRRAYDLIVERRLDELQDLVASLADDFVADDVSVVASDAIEGFNPSHDLCSVIAESAIKLAVRRSGRPIRHLDFLLEAAPDADIGIGIGSGSGDEKESLYLTGDAWQRKLERAATYEELRGEVERTMATHTSSAFRLEVLRRVDPARSLAKLFEGTVPSYESVGEERVAQGVYDRVLRFREHWLPCAEALRSWAEQA